jgi:DNA-directed RNA polymerase specialized sigma24 family protein
MPDNMVSYLEQAARGDEKALAVLFTCYRARLRRMVVLRLDRRLQRRVDPSDILQEAYLDMARRIEEYARNPTVPLFLWMRLLTGQRLVDVHRHHLGARMRDAGLYAQVWDCETGRPSGPPLAHFEGVLAAAFSPDGQRIVTGGDDKSARVWDADTGRPVTPAIRHTNVVVVAFSPDG